MTVDGRLLRVEGVADGAVITRRLAEAGLWFDELIPVRPDLEAVFLQLTAGQGLDATFSDESAQG